MSEIMIESYKMPRMICSLVSNDDGIFQSDLKFDPHDASRMTVKQGRIEFYSGEIFSEPFEIRSNCMSATVDERLDTIFPNSQEHSLVSLTWRNSSDLYLCSNPCTTNAIDGVKFRVTDVNGNIKKNVKRLYLDLIPLR